MKKTFFFLIFILMIAPDWVSAQFLPYFPQVRPPGLNWQQIKTDHFRIIFPDGKDSLAYRAAAILESQYPAASKLTGGTLSGFPVILKPYNDLSNGFVTSFNFRSEFDISPIKGKAMNPKTGDWFETVLPHELVHATHFNVQQDKRKQVINLPNLISYLSPDFARSVHGMVPVGFHEGLAVYHETEEILPGGGRGNYTYVTNWFNANFAGAGRWNMGQTLIPSDYTLPNQRHYISGYSFVDWLHDTYGESVSKESIRRHYSYFFLGYGFALRNVTGKWPGQLYNLYEQDLEMVEKQRLDQIPVNTTEKSRIYDTQFKGEQARSPKWLSDSSLLFYGSFYNGRLGYYKLNLANEEIDLFKEIFSVGDFNAEIDQGSLLYSSYSRDPLYSSVFITDIHRLDLITGKDITLTNNARVYAPTTGGGRLFGIQTQDASGSIVEVLEDDSLKIIKEFQDAAPVSIKFNPVNPRQMAVVVNRRGIQALWLASVDSLAGDLEKEPELAFRNGSVHDPDWHPEGNRILFTMDASPAMNVYEYDLRSNEITQRTSSLYNAFEASYSPGGDSIAYVLQSGNEQKIAVLGRMDFMNELVQDELLLSGDELQEQLSRPLLGSEIDASDEWEKEPYRGGISWLKPRMVLPVIRDNVGTTQFGAAAASIDALSSQSYYAEVTGIQNRLWYNIFYANKTFFPGIELNAYSDPDFFVIRDQNQNEFATMRQTRGFSLSVPFEYTFKGDTRLSSFHIDPEISAEQYKYFNLSPSPISDFATRYKTGAFTQLNLGILNLPRDVQPSSGVSFFGLFEKTLNEPSTLIRYSEGRLKAEFGDQWTAYYGVSTFLSPFRKWNQSLRLDLRFLQQSSDPLYSSNTILPLGFTKNPFPTIIGDDINHNIGRLSSRYTIPLIYPDKGGLTLPLYLSSVYLTGFSHTLTNLNTNDLLASSRSVIGAGLHFQLKWSNARFDFGFGVAFEPSRNKTHFILGQF